MVLHSKELIERLKADNAIVGQDLINVEVCKKFITHFISEQKTINTRISCYQIKHLLEDVYMFLGVPCYVVAKQFRTAAKELGYKMSRDKCFNMSYKRLKAFLEEHGLKGANLL